jgi:hypothetical protein
MANYLLVVLDQAGHQWLLSLPKNQFDSWAQLKQAFIDNFLDMRLKIPPRARQ